MRKHFTENKVHGLRDLRESYPPKVALESYLKKSAGGVGAVFVQKLL